MPKVTGIFDKFDKIDQITTENIASWLKVKPDYNFLENYLANRLIYPQAIPVTLPDLNLELAILREALKTTKSTFFKDQGKKILIPQSFVARIPDLVQLVWTFVDAFLPQGLVTVVLVGQDRDETLGSVVTLKFTTQEKGTAQIEIDGKSYQIKQGSLMAIPCLKGKCKITFQSKDSQIFQAYQVSFEASGGRLGILVDGRNK